MSPVNDCFILILIMHKTLLHRHECLKLCVSREHVLETCTLYAGPVCNMTVVCLEGH